ncbi:MAG: hypothetical protein AMJ60_02590 [Desulfobacterales bacterium SG8_35]|nr:MAG: hypothetical protein AMJ60_02590 [Desulfobacterales bacterium SG8_35]
MPEDIVSKTYVRPDNTAVITCSHCGRQKSIPADSYRGPKSKLRIKCACKKIFTVQLEFRKRVRKKTNLKGTYINHSQKNSSGNIFVRNISVIGLEFTSLDLQNFKVDDELTLTFTLDDEQRSEITKEAVVRDIRQNSIGCEFAQSGEFSFEGPLGFYIMS